MLHALRQRHFTPAFAAILSAKNLAVACRDVASSSEYCLRSMATATPFRRDPLEVMSDVSILSLPQILLRKVPEVREGI